LPLTEYPVFQGKFDMGSADATRELAPYFADWAKHTEYDDYWKQWAIAEHYADIQVPALTVAAWYDIFQGGSLKNFQGLRDHAGNDEARKEQRLLVTIGGHAGGGRKIGAVDFGPAAAEYDELGLTLDWYDYLFQGKKNQFATDNRVEIFVMGKNQWRWEKNWPLERAKETKYYLHSAGKANSAQGDGKLNGDEAKGEAADTFVYDPADPVPTIGGPLCCGPVGGKLGPQDQSEAERRKDVLVYSTAPLDKDVEVTGQVKLILYAKSSAVDTDFTGKLVDVGPDGFARDVAEGILRARYRESTLGAAKLLKPGAVERYEIDRNLNTGVSAAASAKMVRATNSVLHDDAHASVLVLPVVPAE
jgi:putative CocE/NonD family hydrolase